jgi:hypothetical protein
MLRLIAVLMHYHSPAFAFSETVGWYALETRERGLDRSRRYMLLLSE